MLKKLKYVIIALSIITIGIIVAFNIKKKSNFVLMVYMVGSDLESNNSIATSDIRSMTKIGSDKNVNVIVQTGGSEKWRIYDVKENKINRLHIKKNKVSPLEVLENTNMCDSNTLSDFIEYTVDKFPADQYGLILWDHGSGSVYGYGADQLFNYDTMTLSELETGLETAYQKTNVKFEFVGFDCCLMSTLETALTIQPYANYMIASEEIEPGCGYNYINLLKSFKNNDNISGEEIGNIIIDSFVNEVQDYPQAKSLTLSTIDLEKCIKIGELLEKWAISNNDNSNFSEISRAINWCQHYGGRTAYEGYSDMIDLGDFMRQFPDDEIAKQLISVIDEATLRVHFGDLRSGTTGLSVYCPYDDAKGFDKKQTIYNTMGILPNYRSFTDSFISWMKDTNIDIVFDSPTVLKGDNEFNVQLRPEDLSNIKTVHCITGIPQNNGNILGLGFDNDIAFDKETNTISNRSTGIWLGLDEHLVTISITEENINYNLYSIPVLFNGEQVSIQAAWYWDESYDGGGYYKIFGAWTGIDKLTNMSSRDLILIESGDEITTLHKKLANLNSSSEDSCDEYVEGETFIVGEQLILDDIVLKPGDYVFAFEVIDVANRKYCSNFVPFKWSEEQYNNLQSLMN